MASLGKQTIDPVPKSPDSLKEYPTPCNLPGHGGHGSIEFCKVTYLSPLPSDQEPLDHISPSLQVFERFMLASPIRPVEGICRPGGEEAEVEFLPGGPASSRESLRYSSDMDRAAGEGRCHVTCAFQSLALFPESYSPKQKLQTRSSEPDPQKPLKADRNLSCQLNLVDILVAIILAEIAAVLPLEASLSSLHAETQRTLYDAI